MQSWSDAYCTLAQVLPNIFISVTQACLRVHSTSSTLGLYCATLTTSAMQKSTDLSLERCQSFFSMKFASLSICLNVKEYILPAQDYHIHPSSWTRCGWKIASSVRRVNRTQFLEYRKQKGPTMAWYNIVLLKTVLKSSLCP